MFPEWRSQSVAKNSPIWGVSRAKEERSTEKELDGLSKRGLREGEHPLFTVDSEG